MALPADFWRNEQMLNIFRTKPCQRLFRDGVCDWKSQCQYSHCLDWPRRPPQKHNYSPELCVHIRFSQNGEVHVEGICPAGARCQQAHSKEEILYHPHIFKTKLCEEFRSSNGNQRNSRGNNRSRCHRYYCPFAHGQQELRNSPLSSEQRDQCLRALEVFPSDDCCRVCSPHRMDSLRLEGNQGGNVLSCLPCSNQGNPQEVPTSQAPQPQLWALPQPLPAQAALTDSEAMMGIPKDRFQLPYTPQASPPHHLAALGAPQTPMVFQRWGAPNDPSGFTAVAPASLTAEGCGLVVPGQQLPQELQQTPQVHALGGNPAGAPNGTPPPQMLYAMAPATSMQGCGMASSPPGSLPMVQLTPIGQPGAPPGMSLASAGGGPMQMLQVTPVNTASQPGGQLESSPTSHGNEALQTVTWLRSIGLERCVPGLMRNGFDDKEVIAAMTTEDMVHTGMSTAEQQILCSAIHELRRQKNAENQAGLPRSNSMCMALPMANGNAVQRPSAAPTGQSMQQMHPVILSNGAYGQWFQTGSPPMAQAANPGALHNGMLPWSPQAIAMTQFVTPVPQPQQGTEQGNTPQPTFQPGPPQQAGQQMTAQQQDVAAAMVPFLPPVPPFPIQAQQTMQHQAQQSPQQSPPQQPSQQQLQLQMGAQAQANAQSPMVQAGLALQALPPQQQQQLLPMTQTGAAATSSPGAMGNGHASPGISDRSHGYDGDSPASNSFTEDSINGKLQRRRNQKLGDQNKQLMRQVEKLLEAEYTMIVPLHDLRRRLVETGGSIETPGALSRLVQHLKALPDRFLINNEYVTLTKFAHLDPVKSKFDRQKK